MKACKVACSGIALFLGSAILIFAQAQNTQVSIESADSLFKSGKFSQALQALCGGQYIFFRDSEIFRGPCSRNYAAMVYNVTEDSAIYFVKLFFERREFGMLGTFDRNGLYLWRFFLGNELPVFV